MNMLATPTRPDINTHPAPDPQTEGQAPESKPLSERALLAKLTVTNWNDRVLDRTATQEVADTNGVAPGVGRYFKRLLKKDATIEVKRLGQQARDIHNALTMPWDDSGTRILPITAYDRYKTRIDKVTQQREDAVNQFIAEYSQHIQESKSDLGQLFNEHEYPAPQELRSRINIVREFTQVPDGTHFRAELPEGERQRLQKEMAERAANRINAGLETMFQQMVNLVNHASERMQLNDDGTSKRLYDSMIAKLQEMVENAPLLNINDDPRITVMCQQLEAAVNGLVADNLRPNNKYFNSDKKAKFQATVDSMAEQFAGYFG